MFVWGTNKNNYKNNILIHFLVIIKYMYLKFKKLAKMSNCNFSINLISSRKSTQFKKEKSY